MQKARSPRRRRLLVIRVEYIHVGFNVHACAEHIIGHIGDDFTGQIVDDICSVSAHQHV